MKNYFEYQDEKSAKFWEITVEGTTLKTRYGKIDTPRPTPLSFTLKITLPQSAISAFSTLTLHMNSSL
jgi:predicted DNA-binding WGR domain protein